MRSVLSETGGKKVGSAAPLAPGTASSVGGPRPLQKRGADPELLHAVSSMAMCSATPRAIAVEEGDAGAELAREPV